MASCSRAGATCAPASRRESARSMRACTSPIQAWNPASVTTAEVGERLQDLAFEHLDLLARGFEALLAEARQLEAALVRRERLLEGELAGFHARDDLLELGQRGLEGELLRRLAHPGKIQCF